MTVKIDILKVAKDGRGYVFEPMEAAGLATFRNVHVVYTIPGVVRGNHYHVAGTEVCSVSGPTWVRYRENARIKDVQVPEGDVWRFEFPPGVAHAFKNLGAQPSVLAAFNTEAHDPDRPDTVKDILFE